jgi:hypothetical protein
MSGIDTSLPEDLERRIALVSRAENQGESLTSDDYKRLALATVALPILLLIVGWFA